MKVLSHFICILFSPAIASVTDSQASRRRRIAVHALESPNERIFTRKNLISDECKDNQEDVDEILGGNLIEYHLNAVADTDLLPQDCFYESMASAFVCDFKGGSLSRDFKGHCEDEGGAFGEFDINLNCSDLAVVLKAAPGCMGKRCGVEEFINYNEEAFIINVSPESECIFDLSQNTDVPSAGANIQSIWQYFAASITIILCLM